jgi:hypothetical protein
MKNIKYSSINMFSFLVGFNRLFSSNSRKKYCLNISNEIKYKTNELKK